MNIISLFNSLNIPIHKSGNTYSAMCPIHGDSGTPSLIIYPNTDSWYCFGNQCNKGGDAAGFLMDWMGLSYPQALDWMGINKSKDLPFKISNTPRITRDDYPHENIKYWNSLMWSNGKESWFYSRGFSKEFIEDQLWGWDGDRYVVPVWDWKPRKSKCLGARLRTVDPDNPNKYIGISGFNSPNVWGKEYCKDKKTVLCFAGEFDAAKAVSDNLPSFSVVNGVNSYTRFIENWPNLWFPTTENVVMCWDHSEELTAAKFASVWNSYKGLGSYEMFLWPYSLGKIDYNEYRMNHSKKDFIQLLNQQGIYL